MRRLLSDQISWLWLQLAEVGDRRGDPDLMDGAATVTAPRDAASRAESMGLLGRRTVAAGQNIRVDLAELTSRLRNHDPALTPGLVAAHAARRRLAVRAREAELRQDAGSRLRQRMAHALESIPLHAPVRPDISRVWPALQRTGWVARLIAANDVDELVEQAAMVIAGLPETGRRDRRRLADAVTGNPHALDQGSLPGLVLAILVGTEALATAMAPRDSWAAMGVDCDDLTGGLLALGIYPRSWSLPPFTVLTIPPRELLRCTWPDPPEPTAWVYVTENPSVMTAAADYAHDSSSSTGIRLLCTVGTPSAREIEAIARLSAAGWMVAVRADFDEAGLLHVGALLSGVPGAVPWRMGAVDYVASLRASAAGQVPLRGRAVPATDWDPLLQQEMNERGLAAFEETLIDVLLADLGRGLLISGALTRDGG